eukprot:2736911-Pleurochrysis_carterae.AAC.1
MARVRAAQWAKNGLSVTRQNAFSAVTDDCAEYSNAHAWMRELSHCSARNLPQCENGKSG